VTMTKLTSFRWRYRGLAWVARSLEHNRDALAEMPDDADVRRLGEKTEVCLLKVQELRSEIAELIEELEAKS